MMSTCCDPTRSRTELDQILEGFFAPAFNAAPVYPAVNLLQNDASILIEAELPGFKPEELDITIQSDEVTLRGSRALPATEEGARAVRQERGSGAFERTIRLPFPVSAEKAVADFKNGVLTLTLLKPAEAMPRRVRVTTN